MDGQHMTAHRIRPAHLLVAAIVSGGLLVGAHASQASTQDAPSGCHGLSPASAQNCAADVFAP